MNLPGAIMYVVSGLIALAGAGLVYFAVIRPRMLAWGATEDEIRQSLSGDAIVGKPHFIATRAVAINAPASMKPRMPFDILKNGMRGGKW